MKKENKVKGNLQEFLTDRIIDNNISNAGLIFASRESSIRLNNDPKVLQSRSISKKIKK